MTRTTQLAASNTGYLLAAALAGQRYEDASTMWKELDYIAQVEVITALGVQARVAVREVGFSLGVDFSRLGETICAEALTAARMAFEGTGPWRAPQCSHCRELVASALAEVQVKAGIARGVPPSYVELICQAKAESGQIQAS
jgi:hypothetical protein